MTHHQPQAKAKTAPPLKLFLPAHKKTPPAYFYAEGVSLLTAKISFADFIRACQLLTGAAEGDAAGFQNIGPIRHL